ncbi:MAG TPA: serine hydrolase [Vicinamibacterales bacterium]|jgi:CubicO group peptidase (beta-lactamase class C family)|nr:serine hydrolase [Vicinamibacterales bacterium]
MTRWLQTTVAAPLLVAAGGLAGGWHAAAQGPAATEDDLTRVPGATWTAVKPESIGYSSPRLESLRSWLKTLDTKAMLIVVHGQVIFEYGDLAHASKVASVRKSVLSMLYGPYILSGRIDPRKTVVEMGLEEAEPFLPLERNATLEHLLTARSGIYLKSGNDGLDAVAPKRGSEYPGTRMQYNNWDFNAAGTAFEKLSGKTIYQALEEDLARPLGMQDFDRAKQVKVPSPGSVHPEYVMRLSTRDLARLGLLMLRHGRWRDAQVLPDQWVRWSTTMITPFARVHPTGLSVGGQPDRWGYGVMWWVWEEPMFPGGASTGPLQGAFTAMGAGGQYVTVLPAEDMVVVHTTDIDANGAADVPSMAYDAVLAMAIMSRCQSKDRC